MSKRPVEVNTFPPKGEWAMSIQERITYLMGVVVAVIAWSVTELTDTVWNEAIISYSYTPPGKGSEARLTVKNISYNYAPAHLTVTTKVVDGGDDSCTPVVNYDYKNFSSATVVDLESSHEKRINNVRPGSQHEFTIASPENCVYVVDFIVGEPEAGIANTNDERHVRIVKKGIETYVIENRFSILFLLSSSFAAIFAISYLSTLVISWRRARGDV